MNNLDFDIVIVGGGSAGLAAAIGAYDSGTKNVCIIEKTEYLGGILLQCIHSGFGLSTFHEELTGPEYAEKFIAEVKNRGIEYKLNSMVLSIKDLGEVKEVTYSNTEDGVKTLKCKSIILACGCIERSRGAIATPGDRVSGVMSAGIAQRYINLDGLQIGKKVFILGSGDIGLIMARRMVLEGATVLGVAEIMPYSNGLNRNIVQCLNDYNIPLYLSTTVKEIIGKNRLEKIILANVDDKLQFIPGTEREIECDTLLLSIGLVPSTDLFDGANIKIDPLTKSAFVDNNLQTNVKGIFACGNGLHVHDLVDFVSKEGLKAGSNSSNYCKKILNDNANISVINGTNTGYVLPQTISKEDTTIFFRARKPLKKSCIEVIQNGCIIVVVNKPYLIPSEMVNITICKDKFIDDSPITLNCREIEYE